MYVAVQRTIGTSSTSMIVDTDWLRLKIRMCEWNDDIERVFDKHYAWEKLDSGDVITYEGAMYQVHNLEECAHVDELFQGRHIEIFDEDK